ncbi:MAG: hypothetical protein ACOY94_11105 [Bacillota bacterium]
MRKVALLLTLILSVTLALGSIAWAAVPNRSQAPVQLESATGLTGSEAELQAALRENSSVTYKILVVDEDPTDRTAYLDQVLDEWGWPAANELLLVIFPKANYDIRFAMGANFRQSDLTVGEMLHLVRTQYLGRSQQGDAAGGLAALIRTVNLEMSSGGATGYRAKLEALHQVVSYIEQQNVDALIQMIAPPGLFVGPFAVGRNEEPLSPERAKQALTALVDSAKPVIVGYSLTNDEHIGVAIRGIKAGVAVPADGPPHNTEILTDLVAVGLSKVDGQWKLSGVTIDKMGVMARWIAEGHTYIRPEKLPIPPGSLQKAVKPGEWAGLTEADRLTIARKLLTQHLHSYTLQSVPEHQRLGEFRIESLQGATALDDSYPLVMAIYSVRPEKLESSGWAAGNGQVEGAWIVRKLQFLRIGFDGQGYVIQQMSTSP